MKVKIDKDLCIACAACVNTCPDVFSIGKDGKSEVSVKLIDKKFEELVKRAASECPAQAIKITE